MASLLDFLTALLPSPTTRSPTRKLRCNESMTSDAKLRNSVAELNSLCRKRTITPATKKHFKETRQVIGQLIFSPPFRLQDFLKEENLMYKEYILTWSLQENHKYEVLLRAFQELVSKSIRLRYLKHYKNLPQLPINLYLPANKLEDNNKSEEANKVDWNEIWTTIEPHVREVERFEGLH